MNSLSIYKSSAGSGKTYTLVKEYLKLVLVSPGAYRHTLAITFTNKATAEMKSRIISSLVKLSENSDNNLAMLIREELNKPELRVQEKAKQVLELILHDYSGFAVTTIDSFFSRIVRSLSKEMKLPLKFEMEMNQDFVTSRLANMVIEDIGKSEKLTKWLLEFVFSKIDNEKGWKIDHEIKKMANELFSDNIQQYGDDWGITSEFIALLNKTKISFEKQMQAFGTEFLQVIHHAGFEVSDFSSKEKGPAGFFLKISKGLSGEKLQPGASLLKAIDAAEKWVTKDSKNRNEIIALATAELIPMAVKTIDFYTKNSRDYFSSLEVLAVIYLAGITSHLNKKLAQYRDENEVLMISDNNRLIKEFISETDAPFLYEKTGNTFKNYLIDEFQDTADMQWNNLLPLIINGLGTGGSILFVGDAKQSIYRWRGGNMKLLLENIHHDLAGFSNIKNELSLDSNYRSYKAVLDFNNTFFSLAPHLLQVSDKNLIQLAYRKEETLQKNVTGKSDGGFIRVCLFPKKEKTESEKDESWKDAAMDQTIEAIHSCVNKGYDLQDIAILIRGNKEGKIISDALFKNGYTKISSADSLQLSGAPQVTFLINLLTILAYPEENPALAAVIYFYQTVILKNDTADLNYLFSAAGKNSRNKHKDLLPSAWYDEQDNLLTLPLYELTERLVDMFKLNHTPDAYIQRFHDLALEIGGKNQAGIKEFLEWWDDHKDSEKLSVIVPADKNAINLLTIHKSKGLQFPVVIIPFLEWSLKPKSTNLLWITSNQEPYSQLSVFPVRTTKALALSHFAANYEAETDENYLDNLNLLYVAFTRAEEKLFLFAPEQNAEEKEINNAAQLLFKVIENNPAWNTGMVSDENIRKLECGKDHNRLSKKTEKKNKNPDFEKPEAVLLNHYRFNNWQDKLHIRVSRNTGSKIQEQEIKKAIDFGLILHETMSLIKYKDDMESAIKKVSLSYQLENDTIGKLRQEVRQIFVMTESEKWYSEEFSIFNESEIIDPEGTIIRPDRIMVKGNEAFVLDYKTGVTETKHVSQVRQYVHLLRQAGYSRVEGYLLYLKNKEFQKV